MRHTTIKHALAAALAAGALAASPALADPADRVDPAAGTAFGSILYDDWRGEQARDAARVAEHLRSPGHPSQVTPKPAPIVTAAKPDDGDDGVRPILGIALAATGVAALVSRHYRRRARRVPA